MIIAFDWDNTLVRFIPDSDRTVEKYLRDKPSEFLYIIKNKALRANVGTVVLLIPMTFDAMKIILEDTNHKVCTYSRNPTGWEKYIAATVNEIPPLLKIMRSFAKNERWLGINTTEADPKTPEDLQAKLKKYKDYDPSEKFLLIDDKEVRSFPKSGHYFIGIPDLFPPPSYYFLRKPAYTDIEAIMRAEEDSQYLQFPSTEKEVEELLKRLKELSQEYSLLRDSEFRKLVLESPN